MYGPLKQNEVDSFLVEHHLTTRVNPLLYENFPFTPGMLYDTRNTGGFGGMLVSIDSEGKNKGDGWNKTTLSKNTQIRYGTIDVHAWCVDSEGTIHDYDNQTHKNCFFRTNDEIRVAADEETTSALMPILEMIFEKWLEKSSKTVHQHIKDIKYGKFNSQQCWHRAMLLKAYDPDKYTVVLGSLGFKQNDGVNTFYIWG